VVFSLLGGFKVFLELFLIIPVSLELAPVPRLFLGEHRRLAVLDGFLLGETRFAFTRLSPKLVASRRRGDVRGRTRAAQ
jgi:hypothetical protein